MRKYRFISHTADIKIRAYGASLPELINNILLALADYWGPSLTDKCLSKKIKIIGYDQVTLLVDFISQVIFLTSTKKVIFLNFKSENISSNLIEGLLIGKKVTGFSRDIKAVTYHQTKLFRSKGYLAFDFIIDI
ncbi:MAG: archease [Patescibacteria group bacterium]|nr:archease [Patescibacteria group bacterium]